MSERRSTTLDPLPHPVHFVFKDEGRWPELFGGGEPPPAEECAHKFMGAKNSWGVQTYIQLRRRGLDVRLVSRYIPDAICVTTYEHLRISDRPYDSYVVACRHDRGRPEICEQRIVQNKLNIVDATDHYLPHWPQPALIPRDESRGTLVRNVVYQGRGGHLAPTFSSGDFEQRLAAMGMTFTSGEFDPSREVARWNDYRSADVVLAVREASPYILSLKPPSKLFNAWFAGCPALLGPEPAYRQLRRSELDYIEVRTPEDALRALERLRDEPDLYAAMVRNGHERAEEFTPDMIAQQWRNLLAGPVAEGYERWRSQSSAQRRIGRPARFAWRAVAHRRERRHYQAELSQG